MNERQQKVKLLEKFLESYNLEGVCGFIVDPDKSDDPTYEGEISIYIILDLDWVKSIMTKPEFVAKRMRHKVIDDIKRWIGMDVTVGSTAKRCNQITESGKKQYIITESQYKLLNELNSIPIDLQLKVIKKIIDMYLLSAPESIDSIDVYSSRTNDVRIIINFNSESGLDKSSKEKIVDTIWNTIYTYTNIPVFVFSN